MAVSAELSSGLTAIFRSAPTEAQLAVAQATCDTSGLDAALLEAVDSDGASSARTVTKFYQVFYGRQPDAAGLDFHTARLEDGSVSLNQLAEEFASASEFNELFGDQTPTEQVVAQYRNVLGREPDFEGLTFWTNQVNDGNLTLADLGRSFATSPEFDTRSDPFVDALLLNAANGVDTFTPAGSGTGDSLFDEALPTTGPVTPTGAPIEIGDVEGNSVNGSGGADLFHAEDGDISSSTSIDGGGGSDVLEIFNEFGGDALSPRVNNVETLVWTEQSNDFGDQGENNIAGFGFFNTDIQLDAGRMSGVTRWEDYDSRADVIIEDARDSDDTDGTFTGDQTVAMVSTDPGNVDYAIYFDGPTNTVGDDTSTIFIEVLDLDTANTVNQAAVTGNTVGVLDDATLEQFTIGYGGQNVVIALDTTDARVVGPTATYNTLAAAIQDALDANPIVGGDLVASVGSAFNETASPQNSVGAGREIFGLQIEITSTSNTDLDAISRRAFSEDPSRAIAARISDVVVGGVEELIRVNIELDDVGKGSMGGDLLAGAMSTGRQQGDDQTSDSVGIQQFDIEVDRSSQLQTINSTNNSLEVVNIVNGTNDGPNNTTTATDENIGDLVVRGVQSFNGGTNNALPGAAPQHNGFGFSDVRVIDASAMAGDVDLTAELTSAVVGKYFDLDDITGFGNGDDIAFDYDLGTGNDEFFLNMDAESFVDFGTASREDFNLTVDGNSGNDVIVTNIGTANKTIDGQGQDHYVMTALNNSNIINGVNWYANQANNTAATINVNGGTGNDSVWTHGWGDATINAGTGADVVYTDNSGTLENGSTTFLNDAVPLFNLTRNIDEHEQIDYRVGAAWTFNDDNGNDADVSNVSGSTNTRIVVASTDAVQNANLNTVYQTKLVVDFLGAAGVAGTEYTSKEVLIADSAINSFGTINEQQMNQAIKNAINTDPVLNKVLEAIDGPGQSLIVYSKIDGEFVETDLDIRVFEERTTGTTTTFNDYDLAATAYDVTSTDSDFQLLGAASQAESDNRIIMNDDGADDVIVLSTNDAGTVSNTRNLNDASNEVLRFASTNDFGTDTVLNFDTGDIDAGDTGADRFDFREIIDYTGGVDFSNGTFNVNDDSISVVAEVVGNDTAAEVADFYNTAATTGNTPTEHIAIVYDAADNNTGTVYYVTDTAGADNAVATKMGDIELVGTDWSLMTDDNFL